jgi:hypothetical protein
MAWNVLRSQGILKMILPRPVLPVVRQMTHPVRRILAALFALWFTVLTVEPARLHSCPMHGGLDAGGPEHGQPASHTSHGDHQSSESGAPAERHSCNCIGSCATAAAPVAPFTPLLDVAEKSATSPGLPALTRPSVAVAHAIPFANGPPRA